MPEPRLCGKVSKVLLSRVGIPEDYFYVTLDKYTGPKRYKELVSKYLNHHKFSTSEGLGFFMYGANNSGKTTLAMIMAKFMLLNGYTVRVAMLRDIADVYAQGWSDPAVNMDFICNYRDVDFLVIDDLNKEFKNRATLAALDLVLRHRSNKLLPTVVTTNLCPEDVEAEYGRSVGALLERHFVPMEFLDGNLTSDRLIDRNLKLLEALEG